MATAIRMGDLRALGKSEREKAIGGLVNEALRPVNGQAVIIKEKIQSYELRYKMTSDQLPVRLKNKTFCETAEVSNWLFWIRVRELSGG